MPSHLCKMHETPGSEKRKNGSSFFWSIFVDLTNFDAQKAKKLLNLNFLGPHFHRPSWKRWPQSTTMTLGRCLFQILAIVLFSGHNSNTWIFNRKFSNFITLRAVIWQIQYLIINFRKILFSVDPTINTQGYRACHNRQKIGSVHFWMSDLEVP